MFHVSMLKKYYGDGDYIICWDLELFDKNFSYKEQSIATLERDVRKMRAKVIPSLNFSWRNHPVEKAT